MSKTKPIKVVMTKSKLYRADVYRREDGRFTFSLYEWVHESIEEEGYYGEYWSSIARNLSLFDNDQSSMLSAIEALRNLSGEDDFDFLLHLEDAR